MKPKYVFGSVFVLSICLGLLVLFNLHERRQMRHKQEQARLAQAKAQAKKQQQHRDMMAAYLEERSRFEMDARVFYVPAVNEAAVNEQTVQKRFGSGYLVRGEKASDSDQDVEFHRKSNGRYYLDQSHSVTLHIRCSETGELNEIEFQSGVHLPGKPSVEMLRQATTSRLSARELISGSYSLGMSYKAMVAHWGGKPDSDVRMRHMRTIRDHAITEIGGYDEVYRFRDDHLVYARLLRFDELHP